MRDQHLEKPQPLNFGERIILGGSKVLQGFAFPGFLLSRELEGGFLCTVLFWPVTVPCMVVFGPFSRAYDWIFDCDELNRRS